MNLSAIEEDELIIQNLEELDCNFSSIKMTLREIKMKIEKISISSKNLLKDSEAWINFFEIEKKAEISPLSELHMNSLRYQGCADSPNIMNIQSPKNPFIETNSSELLNRSILKDLKIGSESNNEIVLNRSRFENYESHPIAESEDFEGELKEFKVEQLPEIFQGEKDLLDLYYFVKNKGTVSIEEIVARFIETPAEKLEIFINLLCRKNFIKQRENSLTIRK
jgi:hypothetical protein